MIQAAIRHFSVRRGFRAVATFALLALTLSGCTLRDWIGKSPEELQLADIVRFLNTIIDYLGIFAGLVTSFVMIAGYQFLMSAGSEEGQTRAKDTIKYSAVGMLFLVGGYALIKLIFSILVKPELRPFVP